MQPDSWSLYRLMLKSRLLEQATRELWRDGLISGEMHLGTGEEAIIAGVVSQLEDGDAMALDHRPTAAMLVRGVDPVLIIRELLGRPDGLCRGMGGHMHLFSREHLAASSGIVGAAAPAAAGFGLSAQRRRPGSIAVAFFGDGAVNQGMLMESMNLAVAWSLPVLFVCKDDGWAITTSSAEMTGGTLFERARGFGMPALEVDGTDVSAVLETASEAIGRARAGGGPTFLHARCVHFEGHFLGFQLLRLTRDPIRELPRVAIPLTRSFLRRSGENLRSRLAGLKSVMGSMVTTLRDPRRDPGNDPVLRLREQLSADRVRLEGLERETKREIDDVLKMALEEVAS